MSQVVESLARQRMRVAAIVASCVAAVLFVQDVIGSLVSVMVGFTLDTQYGYDYWGYFWQSFGFGNLMIIAFTAGVWVSLWHFAAVTATLDVAVVVLRGLLASAVGAALVFLVQLSFSLIGPLSGVDSMFGNSFPELPWNGIVQAAAMAFQTAIGAFVQQAPIAILVLVLAWLWLQKHPFSEAS